MNDQKSAVGPQGEDLTREQLMERINDRRVRILEQLGIEVPETLKAGASDASN